MEEKIKNFFEENKFKIGFLVFVLIIGFLVFYYFTIYQSPKTGPNNTTLQNKCAVQANTIFNNIQQKISDTNYTYKSHYISSLDRCYILIHGVGVGQIGTSDKLINVYSNKEVADCESYTTAPELNFCSYNDSENIRYNLDDFNSFVKPYMETK